MVDTRRYLEACEEAMEAYRKFTKTGLPDKFITRLDRTIRGLDDKRAGLYGSLTQSTPSDEAKIKEIGDIEDTFRELKKIAICASDLYAGKYGRPTKATESVCRIFCECLWGKAKKESPPFSVGFQLGYAFALKYGAVVESCPNGNP